jgi:hypothetical protein
VKKKVNLLAAFFFLFYCLFGNGLGRINSNIAKASGAPEIKITVPDKIYVQDSFDVVVNINNVTDLYGVSMDFVYDPKTVEIVSVEKGNIFASNEKLTVEYFNTIDPVAGLVTYARFLTTDVYGVNGSGTLFTLHCKAVGAGEFKWSVTPDAKEKLSLTGNTSRILLSDSYVKSISYIADTVTKTVILDTMPPKVSANLKGALYNAAQSVTLSAEDDYDTAPSVYYTTDGSTPTTNSTKYTSAINISKNTTLKFIGVDNRGNKSQVYTEQYTIDTVAPVVSGVDPINNGADVLLNKKIVVNFSESIKAGNSFSNITLVNSRGEGIAVTRTVVGKTLELQPTSPLEYGTTYTLNIPAGAINDLAGNSLAAVLTSSFKTVYMFEDVNRDSLVDLKDVAFIAQNYKLQSGDNGWLDAYDLNKDAIIDIFDLVIVSKKIKN